MERPSTITPGPTTPNHWTPLGRGGAGISATVHGARPERASGAVDAIGEVIGRPIWAPDD
ncbi:MAG TPA: hypothetical protein VFT63_05350, partial [bacterium]|nr:hypothetical protein [bacterium]